MESSGKGQAQNASQTRRRGDGRARKRLSAFAEGLLREWKRLCLPVEEACGAVVVAVSGGADSVALLLGMEELLRGERVGIKVLVAHLDHGLRREAGREDARWVEALAEKLKFEVVLGLADVKERAARESDNLEQAARRSRYEFLSEAAKKCGARVVLTGHTMDDQAETLLLRLLRGSGAEGLGGMEPMRALNASSETLLVRPLLSWAGRARTVGYCRARGIEFRADLMNEDETYARVRVRRQLLPLMETFNPRVVQSLARTAELLREDSAVLRCAAEELLKSAGKEEEKEKDGKPVEREPGASITRSLSVDILKSAPAALRRRALRLWLASMRGDLRRLELVHLVGVEKLLEGVRGGRRAELPGGSFVEIRRGRLRFYVK